MNKAVLIFREIKPMKKSIVIDIASQTGFTLIEMIVGAVIGMIIAGAILMVWMSQEKTYLHETDKTALHTRLRAAIYLLERDLRSAGYMRTCASPPCLSFTSATSSSLSFQTWDDADGNVTTITYQLYSSSTGGGMALGRQKNSATIQPVAYYIEALNFVYLDKQGNVLPAPVSADHLDNINSIEIAIVGRSKDTSLLFSHGAMGFKNMQGNTIFTAPADRYIRKAILTKVYCRNNFPQE